MAKKEVKMDETPNEQRKPTEGEWKHASATIWQPEQGDILIGVYDGSASLPAKIKETMKKKKPDQDFDRDIVQHFFLVGEGDSQKRYSLIGGEKFDTCISESEIKKGTLCRIEYLGQVETSSGNRLNDWSIMYQYQ